jgi:hypothetical protein
MCCYFWFVLHGLREGLDITSIKLPYNRGQDASYEETIRRFATYIKKKKKKNDKLAEAYQFDNNRVTQIEKKNHTN